MPGQGSRLAALLADRRGSLLPIAVGGMLAVSAAGALAVDIGAAFMVKGELEGAADAVALAAVVELPDPAAVRQVGLDYAQRNLSAVYLATSGVEEPSGTAGDDANEEGVDEEEDVESSGGTPGDRSPKAARLEIEIGAWDQDVRRFTVTTEGPDAVRVTLRRSAANGNPFSTLFARLLGVDELSVGAQAVATRSNATCVYVLEPTGDRALSLSGSGAIEIPQCSMQISSTSDRALNITGSVRVETLEACIAGDYAMTGSGSVSPAPKTGCDAAGDPLVAFPAPGFGGCDYNDVRITGSGSHALTPGVYCGGIKMSGSHDATFEPGIYVIKDGPLKRSGSGTITGTSVAFYFTGSDAHADLSGSTDISLTAPSSGPLAGFVFYQGPFAEADLTSTISGGGAIYYEGTVYFPDHHVDWSGSSVVSTPPCTLFVVKTLRMTGSTVFRAAADYASSAIPSPPGMRARGASRLAQ